MRLYTIVALGEAPVLLFDEPTMIGHLTLDNPSATTTAYFKIFETSEAPDVSTDVPTHVIPAGIGVTDRYLGVVVGPCYVAATTEVGAGNTAPDEDINLSLGFRRA